MEIFARTSWSSAGREIPSSLTSRARCRPATSSMNGIAAEGELAGRRKRWQQEVESDANEASRLCGGSGSRASRDGGVAVGTSRVRGRIRREQAGDVQGDRHEDGMD